MKFILHNHNPIAKKRPRFMRRGKLTIVFDAQEKEKEHVRNQLSALLATAASSDCTEIAEEASNLAQAASFDCRLAFYVAMPEGWSSMQKNEKLWRLSPCVHKCDLDNYEKFYLDCMNGILYSDDRKITSLRSSKQYSLTPRVEIEIMAKKDLSINEQAKGILQIFGPHELMEFITDVQDLFELYDLDEEQDRLLDEEYSGNLREIRLARTAITLSKVADKHCKAFKKINSRYPDFWKKCHHAIGSPDEPYHHGKTIC